MACISVLCNKSFGDNFNLLMHYRTHRGECPHVCNECSVTLRLMPLYIRVNAHICVKSVARVSDKLHIYRNALFCTRGRGLPYALSAVCLTELKNHNILHAVDLPHECELCTKKITTPARLRKHRYTHKTAQHDVGSFSTVVKCG